MNNKCLIQLLLLYFAAFVTLFYYRESSQEVTQINSSSLTIHMSDTPTANPPEKEPTKPTEPTTPTEPIEPIEPVEPTEPGKKPTTPTKESEVDSKNKLLRYNNRPFAKEKVSDREGPSTFLQHGGLVSYVDKKTKVLCNLKVMQNCHSNYIADVIDLVYAFAPLYAIEQNHQSLYYTLHDYFLAYMKSIGINSIVLEAIIPRKGQKYLRTQPGKEPYEIQITVDDTFYYRENLLNVMARKTYDLWEYMLWIDAHQVFENIYWWEESIYQMEQKNIAHLFQHVYYMRNDRNVTWLDYATVTYKYQLYNKLIEGTNYFAGNAWGIRKEKYKELDYILDTCIAGGCDYSLCYSLLKHTDDWPGGFSKFPHYFNELKPWILKAHDVLEESFAVIRGKLFHIEHPHLFDYFGIQTKIGHCCFSIKDDLVRDENYTLHIKNPQVKEYFPK